MMFLIVLITYHDCSDTTKTLKYINQVVFAYCVHYMDYLPCVSLVKFYLYMIYLWFFRSISGCDMNVFSIITSDQMSNSSS
jgi:hypothetical protein